MATTGPGRPENKNAPATDSEGAELEKTLEDATAGVVETAKSNSNLIIIVVLGIVALLALPSVLDRVDEQKLQKLNNEIDSCLNQETEAVVQSYPSLLDQLSGTPVEAYAYTRVATWLWEQEDEALRDSSVTVLEQAKGKFPNDALIERRIMEYSTAIASGKTFVLPEIPVVEPEVVEETVVETTVTEPEVTPTAPTLTEELPDSGKTNEADSDGAAAEPAPVEGEESGETGGSGR